MQCVLGKIRFVIFFVFFRSSLDNRHLESILPDIVHKQNNDVIINPVKYRSIYPNAAAPYTESVHV